MKEGNAISGSAIISADSIGAAARFDPQLKVPLRPRVRRGLMIRYEADRVVVRGGPKGQLLKGRSATTMLPTLLGLLDGELGHAELAERLDIPVGNVFMALSPLWTCGVIEEGPSAEVPGTSLDTAVVDFLSRMGDSTGANASWEDAAARLNATRIEVFGEPALAAALCAEFDSAVHCVPAEEALPSPSSNLVVLIDDGGSLGDVARHCWDKGIRLVRLRIQGRTAELGPFVDAQLTPCLDCLAAERWDDPRPAEEGDHALTIALFARELFTLVSRDAGCVMRLVR